LPDNLATLSLPFFERNVLTETTHCATASWIEADVHPADLASGRVYVVHLVMEKTQEPDFNFLWPMRFQRDDSGAAHWHFPIQPPDRPWPKAELEDAQCKSVVGIVVDITRDENPIDLPFLPGFKFS